MEQVDIVCDNILSNVNVEYFRENVDTLSEDDLDDLFFFIDIKKIIEIAISNDDDEFIKYLIKENKYTNINTLVCKFEEGFILAFKKGNFSLCELIVSNVKLHFFMLEDLVFDAIQNDSIYQFKLLTGVEDFKKYKYSEYLLVSLQLRKRYISKYLFDLIDFNYLSSFFYSVLKDLDLNEQRKILGENLESRIEGRDLEEFTFNFSNLFKVFLKRDVNILI